MHKIHLNFHSYSFYIFHFQTFIPSFAISIAFTSCHTQGFTADGCRGVAHPRTWRGMHFTLWHALQCLKQRNFESHSCNLNEWKKGEGTFPRMRLITGAATAAGTRISNWWWAKDNLFSAIEIGWIGKTLEFIWKLISPNPASPPSQSNAEPSPSRIISRSRVFSIKPVTSTGDMESCVVGEEGWLGDVRVNKSGNEK